MSIAILKKIVDEFVATPDEGIAFDSGARRVDGTGKPAPYIGRIKASTIVAACDEVPLDKIDKKAKDIRLGSANAMREQPTPEKAAEVLVIVPIGYLRHLVKLAGG